MGIMSDFIKYSYCSISTWVLLLLLLLLVVVVVVVAAAAAAAAAVFVILLNSLTPSNNFALSPLTLTPPCQLHSLLLP